MKAYEKMKDYEPIVMPWSVGRFFPKGFRTIDIMGNMASLGEDYGNVEELREVVEWLADQFGGKVKWSK